VQKSIYYYKNFKHLFWGFALFSLLFGCNDISQQSKKEAGKKPCPSNLDVNLIATQRVDKVEQASNFKQLEYYLKQNANSPFKVDKEIDGICFIIPSDKYNHYKNVIVLHDADNVQDISIRLVDSVGMQITKQGKHFAPHDEKSSFSPWLWGGNPDYFSLVFDCVDTAGHSYKVKINDKEFAWIQKTDTLFEKIAINDYLLPFTEIFGFEFNRTINPLRIEPQVNARVITHPLQEKYDIWSAEAIRIQGEWLKIQVIGGKEQGWIRWRKGNLFLIRIQFSC